MTKKSSQEQLADWIASMEHRPVSKTVLERKLKESNLTESEVLKGMDETEKKDLLSDQILFDKWIECIYNHRQKSAMEKFLNARLDSDG